jgi:hypothetical protein
MHGEDMAFGWRLLRALSLSDAQKAQVREAFATYRMTVQSQRDDMHMTRQHLVDALLNPDTLDTDAIHTAQQHLAELHANLLQARITLAEAIRSALTQPQLTQATQIIQQLRALRGEVHQLLTPQTQP